MEGNEGKQRMCELANARKIRLADIGVGNFCQRHNWDITHVERFERVGRIVFMNSRMSRMTVTN